MADTTQPHTDFEKQFRNFAEILGLDQNATTAILGCMRKGEDGKPSLLNFINGIGRPGPERDAMLGKLGLSAEQIAAFNSLPKLEQNYMLDLGTRLLKENPGLEGTDLINRSIDTLVADGKITAEQGSALRAFADKTGGIITAFEKCSDERIKDLYPDGEFKGQPEGVPPRFPEGVPHRGSDHSIRA